MSWEPFRRVRDAVVRDPASPWSACERLVALIVADCMGEDGTAHPSVALIAMRCGLGRRTVQRALARLSGSGGIFVEATGGSTAEQGRTSSVYRLATRAMLARVPAPQGRRSDPRHTDTRATDDTDPRHSGAVRTQEGLIHHVAARRAAGKRSKPTVVSSWSVEACQDWKARFAGSAPPGGRIGRALKPLVIEHGWPAVRLRWKAYLAAADARFVNPQKFAATFGDWGPHARPVPPEPTAPMFVGERRFGR